MRVFDLVTIAERFMELINPSTPEKIITVGRLAGLRPGSRVIEFGAGFGEVLALWAQHFGITGIGIDIRPAACQSATQRLAVRGLTERIEIVCADAAEYRFTPHAFDIAACVGASFIWQGYQPTIRAMRSALRPGGKLVIGEPYWNHGQAPPAYVRQHPEVHTEPELLAITRAEGCVIEGVVRTSHDDWDRYRSDNWRGLLRWLAENPDHPERQEVVDFLQRDQEEYLRYGREHLGWAIYVLTPVAG